MRFAAMIAGLLACTVIFLANNQEVSAQSEDNASKLTSTDVLTLLDKSSLAEKLASRNNDKPNKDKTVEYVVSEGDTLAGIAKSYDVKWTRIFNKNDNISNPDVLNPGITIIIPDASEELPDRVAELQVEAPKPVENTQENSYQTQTISRPSSDGNTYAYGYCTWYAKQRRPDLPNQLGNAYLWVSSARSMGIPTGSTPRAGAIGQSGNHVVYIEKVNGDGTVTVSDMNYGGWGVVTTRKAPASSFQYIY